MAEYTGNRIRMWSKNASTGVTVVGGISQSSNSIYLSSPSAVWVDENTKIVYVIDLAAMQIQRWQGSNGDIIVGMSCIHINCYEHYSLKESLKSKSSPSPSLSHSLYFLIRP